jgi:hypothetical protein
MTTHHSDLLHQRIQLLKEKQATELAYLKNDIYSKVDSLQPANLIKKGLNNIIQSADVKQSALNLVVGLATAFISKKIITGKSPSTAKNIIGSIAEYAIMGLVAYFNQKEDTKKEAE